jgi:hypothetical protein
MDSLSYQRSVVTTVIAFGVVALIPLSAAAQMPNPPSGPCLTADQKKVNADYYALSRPTSRDDQMPFFDPEYFAGTWNFESRVLDSPLGPGGESVGKLTIKSTGGCNYEGELKAEDPDGKPFTRKIKLTFDPAKKVLSWTEADSRGYTLTKSGPVGGELGGLFHHHFEEGPTITVGGQKVSVTGVSEMSSPAYFKSDFKISINGAPTKTFGRATYEKQMTP